MLESSPLFLGVQGSLSLKETDQSACLVPSKRNGLQMMNQKEINEMGRQSITLEGFCLLFVQSKALNSLQINEISK